MHSWALRSPPVPAAVRETLVEGAADTVRQAWEDAFDAAAETIRDGATAPFDAVVDGQEAMIVPARDSAGTANISESLAVLADLRHVVTTR